MKFMKLIYSRIKITGFKQFDLPKAKTITPKVAASFKFPGFISEAK